MYEYEVNLSGNHASARVARLVGTAKRVLEIGCAAGSQTRVLQQLGCSVTAIELDAESAEIARPFCDILIVGNIESLDLSTALADARFDVVIFADVLEHLRDPAAALLKVKPYLLPTGYLVASIPNVAHASLVLELAQGRFEYRSRGLLDRTHIRFFTRQSVAQLFEETGYLIEVLDRVRIEPRHTEFGTALVSPGDEQVMNYILSRNAEALTYQFVVRAAAVTGGGTPLSEAMLAVQQRFREVEEAMSRQRTEITKLSSQLQWLESRWWYRAVTRLRRAIAR